MAYPDVKGFTSPVSGLFDPRVLAEALIGLMIILYIVFR